MLIPKFKKYTSNDNYETDTSKGFIYKINIKLKYIFFHLFILSF